MELTQVLRRLWGRRVWVAAGACVALLVALTTAYHVHAFPPSLHKKSLQVGAAQTQILVDSQHSVLANVSGDFAPLAGRATFLSNFMTSAPVLTAIGRAAGIPGSVIVASSEIPNLTSAAAAPTPQQRAAQLAAAGVGYQLDFRSDGSLPTVDIFATAPTASQAIRLANGAATGLQKVLTGVADQEGTPQGSRVVIRQLGTATGGILNKGANVSVAIMTFFALLLGVCIIVVIIDRAAREWRLAGRRGSASEPLLEWSSVFGPEGFVTPLHDRTRHKVQGAEAPGEQPASAEVRG